MHVLELIYVIPSLCFIFSKDMVIEMSFGKYQYLYRIIVPTREETSRLNQLGIEGRKLVHTRFIVLELYHGHSGNSI